MSASNGGLAAMEHAESQSDARPRVLFVDDDERLLAGIALRLRRLFDVTTATSAVEALALLDLTRPFAAVVSDMRMPKNDGATFLSAIQRVAPETTRMLLTGQADVQSAIAAVNEGEVFKFLLKPIEANALVVALNQAVARHEETMLQRRTAENVMRELANFLVLPIESYAPAFAAEIRDRRQLVVHIATTVCPRETWMTELACVAMHAALIDLPTNVSSRWLARSVLTPAEQAQVEQVVRRMIDLIGRIPGTSAVCDTIAWTLPLAVRNVGWCFPATASMSTRVLHVVMTFASQKESHCSDFEALAYVRGRAAASDAALVSALATAVSDVDKSNVPLFRLSIGQRLLEEVRLVNGVMFLPAGHEVTPGTLVLIAGLDAISRHTNVRIALENVQELALT